MKKVIIFMALSLIVGFSQSPKKTMHICSVPQNDSTWYRTVKQTENKWGVPVVMQMAIIKHELNLKTEAKAKTLSAAQFSQAQNKTWANYQRSASAQARCNEFAATTDFSSWNVDTTKRHLGISS